MKSLITIVIPTYNRGKILLERALPSVFNQNEKNGFEIIVVDDGSTDGTENILRPLIEEGKIKYLYQQNKGVSAARNFGIKSAKGDIIVLLDSDDELLPEYLTVVKKAFASSDAEVLIPGFILKDEFGKVSKAPTDKPEWMFGIGGGGAFKKSVFTKNGIWYDEKLRNFEDSDLGFRLLQDCKVHFLEEYIYVYHFNKMAMYSDTKSLSSDSRYLTKDFEMFKEKNLGFYKSCGPKAMNHLYFWEGTIYGNSDINKAREAFSCAFKAKPSIKSFIYLAISIWGSRTIYKAANKSFIFMARQYKILRNSL